MKKIWIRFSQCWKLCVVSNTYCVVFFVAWFDFVLCLLQNKLTTIEPYILFLCRCLRSWTVAMDADQASRKRGVLLNYDKCIICQEDNKQQKLVTPTSDGLKTIHNARQVRLKLRNNNFRPFLLFGSHFGFYDITG